MTIKEFRCESCGKTFLGQGNSKFCYDCRMKRMRGIREIAKEIIKDEDIKEFLNK